ncbi:unnamed protein product [Mycena citricolor]|nr:unnamed protein product [Mycena citricolor]
MEIAVCSRPAAAAKADRITPGHLRPFESSSGSCIWTRTNPTKRSFIRHSAATGYATIASSHRCTSSSTHNRTHTATHPHTSAMSCSSVMAYYGYFSPHQTSPPARDTYQPPVSTPSNEIPAAEKSPKRDSTSLRRVVQKILHPRRGSSIRSELSRSSSQSSVSDAEAETA